MKTDKEKISEIIDKVKKSNHIIKLFGETVHHFFEDHPTLRAGPLPTVHSVKSRLKDHDHLADKISRKIKADRDITVDNVFQEITDLAGVRVLHLYPEDFLPIHKAIIEHIEAKEWVFHEPPKAYTWDPEVKELFEQSGLSVEVKESFYTSIHYVVRPRPDALASCEIQVRTLFEEIWGEIDHSLNYPHPTSSVANREQLRVLARLISTGSRLATSIARVQKLEHTPIIDDKKTKHSIK